MNLIPRSNSLFLDDMFNDFFSLKDTNSFKCDIYEKDNKYFIELDIPGTTINNTKIECDNGYLTINVSKEEENTDEEKNYIRRERNIKSFSRSFYIGDINTDQIKADFKNGTLTIEVPKEEKKETKKIIEISEN